MCTEARETAVRVLALMTLFFLGVGVVTGAAGVLLLQWIF